GGGGRRFVQRNATFEIVGELGAMLRFASAEGIAGQIVSVANVINAGNQRAEPLAIIVNSADRGTAEIDAVIAALAPDQARLRCVAFGPMIGECDLERGLNRL